VIVALALSMAEAGGRPLLCEADVREHWAVLGSDLALPRSYYGGFVDVRGPTEEAVEAAVVALEANGAWHRMSEPGQSQSGWAAEVAVSYHTVGMCVLNPCLDRIAGQTGTTIGRKGSPFPEACSNRGSPRGLMHACPQELGVVREGLVDLQLMEGAFTLEGKTWEDMLQAIETTERLNLSIAVEPTTDGWKGVSTFYASEGMECGVEECLRAGVAGLRADVGPIDVVGCDSGAAD